jgi:hypothetical protein
MFHGDDDPTAARETDVHDFCRPLQHTTTYMEDQAETSWQGRRSKHNYTAGTAGLLERHGASTCP